MQTGLDVTLQLKVGEVIVPYHKYMHIMTAFGT